MTLLVDDSVFVSVNGWINAETEGVLVVLCQRTWTDNVAPVGSLARIDVNNRNNAGSTSFYANAAGLVELECKDVFVIGQGDDELDDQLSSTGDDGTASTPIGVFPVDAIVLLVDTDDIRCLLAFAIRSDYNTIEVFDDT